MPASTDGVRKVPQALLRAAPAGGSASERSDDAPLDRGRTLILDQLLADGQDQRLEGLRAPSDPQPRPLTQRPADQRVAEEAPPEATEVLVDAEREAHSSDPMGGGLAAAGTRAEDHDVGRRLGYAHDHRHLAVVKQPLDHPATASQHAVHPVEARQPELAGGQDLLAKLDEPVQGGALSAADRPARAGARRRAASGCRRSAGARLTGAAVRPGRPPRRRAALAAEPERLCRRCTRPTTAAPATKPPAATAAAWTAGMTAPPERASAPPIGLTRNVSGSLASTGSASMTSASPAAWVSSAWSDCGEKLTRRSVDAASDP